MKSLFRNGDADIWEPVVRLMDKAVAEDVFPGAVLLVGKPRAVLFHRAFGLGNRFTGEKVSLDTLFDLASLTKPLATTLAIICLIQEGKLSLDTCVGTVLTEIESTEKKMIRIQELLYHTSGLPAHREYFREVMARSALERRGMMRWLLVREPLVRPAGTFAEYSDLGFMLLSWIIERITGVRFDHFVKQRIYAPLGLHYLYFVDRSSPRLEAPFAATEFCPWRKTLLVGEVSDDNAWAAGGIEGHAGLFGTANDVFTLLNVLMAAYHGDGRGVFLPSIVQTFFKKDPLSSRALGFDTPSREGSSCGRYFSNETVGHLGFTGTSFWMDLEREIMVILLTNRVHPDRNNNRIREFRPVIHDAVMEILVSEPESFRFD